jgi:hypothetical protein
MLSYTNAGNPWTNYLTTHWNIWGYFGVWRLVRRYLMPRLKLVISKCFWKEAATKIPEKIMLVGSDSGARQSEEHRMSAAANFFFIPKKKTDSRKPEVFCITFDRRNSNQIRTRPGPEHYLCYQAQAQALLYLHLATVPQTVTTFPTFALSPIQVTHYRFVPY